MLVGQQSTGENLTPKESVRELDKYIIGQKQAKKAVAIALRNRIRRMKLTPEMAELAYPMHTGPALIGGWKHAGGFEPQLAFTAMLLVMLSLVLLVIVKIVIMKVKLPMRKVFPGPERLLSKGAIPKLKDGLSFIFMIVVLIIPSFFIFSFVITESGSAVDWGGFWSAMGFSFLVAGVITVINLIPA